MIALVLALLTLSSSPEPSGGVDIVRTRSTNSAGYTIAVDSQEPFATVTFTGAAPSRHIVLTPDSRKALFDVLAALPPLQTLEVRRCAKPVSFAASTFVVWNGHTSPDLSCGGDAGVQRLLNALRAIEAQLNLPPRQPRPGPPLHADQQ